MLELLAFTREDGWAFIRTDGELRLIRPPYTRKLISDADEKSVATALTRYGFTLPPDDHKNFASWSALLDFLNAQIVEFRGKIDESAGQSLIEFASAETLQRFLERIRDELIPKREWEHAEKLLLNMLKAPLLREQTELFRQAVDLLNQVYQRRTQRQSDLRAIACENADYEKAFPMAHKRYGRQKMEKFSGDIAERHSVLAF